MPRAAHGGPQRDGLVIIDPGKAQGRREIATSCRYGAIYWNEARQLAQKCTGCAHLLDDGWTETRWSQVCPTEAIKLVMAEDAEFDALVAAEGLERYRDGLGTKPRVWYKNLHLWDKVFVGASLAYADTDECAAGAAVTVTAGGEVRGRSESNAFGEFIVDALEPGEEYTVTVEAAGYEAAVRSVTLEKSLNLGLVKLQRA